MSSDLIALANSDFSSPEWEALAREKPDVAEALHYLLLMEKHGGRDADKKFRRPAELTQAVADEMKMSVQQLAIKRREWTNGVGHVLEEARAWLQPIRAEQDAFLADQIASAWSELVLGILEKGLAEGATFYEKRDAALFLKKEVLQPAAEKQKPTGNEEAEYIEISKKLDSEALLDEEAYLNNQ